MPHSSWTKPALIALAFLPLLLAAGACHHDRDDRDRHGETRDLRDNDHRDNQRDNNRHDVDHR